MYLVYDLRCYIKIKTCVYVTIKKIRWIFIKAVILGKDLELEALSNSFINWGTYNCFRKNSVFSQSHSKWWERQNIQRSWLLPPQILDGLLFRIFLIYIVWNPLADKRPNIYTLLKSWMNFYVLAQMVFQYLSYWTERNSFSSSMYRTNVKLK